MGQILILINKNLRFLCGKRLDRGSDKLTGPSRKKVEVEQRKRAYGP